MIILLVDDEFPARQELRFVLEQLLPEATFYEASHGDEALTILTKLRADVVFLDINMPGQSGLTVAAIISDSPDPPLIIFATAYDQHALKAFELAALDYVVKPFSKRRLSKTVIQIRQRLGQKNTLTQQKTMIEQFLSANQSALKPSKLWAEQSNGNRVLIAYTDIIYIEAKNKQVYAYTLDGKQWRIRYTLKALEARLTPHAFCRTHKAYLVNLEHIAAVIPWFSGSYQIKFNDTNVSVVPVSRRYVAQLKQHIDW